MVSSLASLARRPQLTERAEFWSKSAVAWGSFGKSKQKQNGGKFQNFFFMILSGRDEGTKSKLGNYLYIYETFVIIWITFGLGYVLMIILAISDGLKKPAAKVAKKLRKAEKVVLEKVLNEVVALKRRNHQNVNEQRNTADVSDGLSFHNDAFEVTPSNTGNSDVSDLIEEMNQDTITSLRNFVDSASQYHRKRRHSPNLYIHSTTASSITSSNDSITTSGGGKSASVHGDNNVIASSAASSNWRRLMPRKLSLRSKLASL